MGDGNKGNSPPAKKSKPDPTEEKVISPTSQSTYTSPMATSTPKPTKEYIAKNKPQIRAFLSQS